MYSLVVDEWMVKSRTEVIVSGPTKVSLAMILSATLKNPLVMFLMVVAVGAAAAPTPSLQPLKLTCEYQMNPLGIDTRKPRLSWIFQSAERNQLQSAYEIVVSAHQASINQLIGDAWNSGKILSSSNLHIEYAGVPLNSFTRYYWRVRVYDKNNQVSEWSSPAWFETAMLQASDWKAGWRGDGTKQFERDEDFYRDDRMPLFRKTFVARKKVSAARLKKNSILL